MQYEKNEYTNDAKVNKYAWELAACAQQQCELYRRVDVDANKHPVEVTKRLCAGDVDKYNKTVVLDIYEMAEVVC